MGVFGGFGRVALGASVAVQLLRSEQHRMAVFSAMLVGTVCGVAVLGTTLMTLARRSQPVKRRQRASVTEILQVDMVDRGLYYTATNIDCSLDMELHTQSNLNTSSYSDQVLKPPKGGFNEVFA